MAEDRSALGWTELYGRPGERIEEAIDRLVTAAPGALTFNGTRVSALAGDTALGLYRCWCEARATQEPATPSGPTSEGMTRGQLARMLTNVTALLYDIWRADAREEDLSQRFGAQVAAATKFLVHPSHLLGCYVVEALRIQGTACAEGTEGCRVEHRMGHGPLRPDEPLAAMVQTALIAISSGGLLRQATYERVIRDLEKVRDDLCMGGGQPQVATIDSGANENTRGEDEPSSQVATKDRSDGSIDAGLDPMTGSVQHTEGECSHRELTQASGLPAQCNACGAEICTTADRVVFSRDDIAKEIAIRERKVARSHVAIEANDPITDEDIRDLLFEELEQVRYAFGLEKRGEDERVVQETAQSITNGQVRNLDEVTHLRKAIEDMVMASDNDGGSASDAIQDMLEIASDALKART